MGAAHGAAPRCHRRGAHLVDPEHFECGRRPDDVDDRVVPADLVEVDLLDRAPVQHRLDGGEQAEHGQRALRHPRREGRLLDQRRDRPMGADDHVVAGDDRTRAGDASPHARLEPQVPTGKGEPVEQPADLVDVRPGVDERAEGHVAGNAREAVEPGDRRCDGLGLGHGNERAIAQAAPYPLSMPTTVMPDEQAESMDSSAVTPSSAAP